MRAVCSATMWRSVAVSAVAIVCVASLGARAGAAEDERALQLMRCVVAGLGEPGAYSSLPDYHARLIIDAESPGEGLRRVEVEEWHLDGSTRVNQIWFSAERSPERRTTVFLGNAGKYYKCAYDSDEKQAVASEIPWASVPINALQYRIRLLAHALGNPELIVGCQYSDSTIVGGVVVRVDIGVAGGKNSDSYMCYVDDRRCQLLAMERVSADSRRTFASWRKVGDLAIPFVVEWNAAIASSDSQADSSRDWGRIAIDHFEIIDELDAKMFDMEEVLERTRWTR